MNTTNKRLIISNLSKQNQAFKKIKKQHNLTSKDIEILAAASILTDQETFFSAKEIRIFMGNSYYSADVAYSLLRLCELDLV
jgi:hypothetical protein